MVSILNLKFGFKEKYLYDNLNINFVQGINLVEGRNGAGKTTLFNILYKEITGYKGSIFIESVELKDICKEDLRSKYIKYINQDIKLFKDLTVIENIDIINPKKKDKVLKLLDLLLMGDLLDRQVKDLSGGEKQKLNFSINYICDHPIVILDEPFNNLDNRSIYLIERLIYKTKKCLIIVAHNKNFKGPVNIVNITKSGKLKNKKKKKVIKMKFLKYYWKNLLLLGIIFITASIITIFYINSISFKKPNKLSNENNVMVTHSLYDIKGLKEIYPVFYSEGDDFYSPINEERTGKFIDTNLIDYSIYNDYELINQNNEYIFENGFYIPIYTSELMHDKDFLKDYNGENNYNIDSILYGDFPDNDEILIDTNLALFIAENNSISELSILIGQKVGDKIISGIYSPKESDISYVYTPISQQSVKNLESGNYSEYKYHTYYGQKSNIKDEMPENAVYITGDNKLMNFINYNKKSLIYVFVIICVYIILCTLIIIFEYSKNKKTNEIYKYYGFSKFSKTMILIETFLSIIIFIITFTSNTILT